MTLQNKTHICEPGKDFLERRNWVQFQKIPGSAEGSEGRLLEREDEGSKIKEPES